MGHDLDLPRSSTCIVAGAYEGNVMELLDEVYAPERIVGFEPQWWAFQYSWERLRSRPSCLVLPYGISAGERGYFPMGEFHTDACTFMPGGDRDMRDRGEGLLQPVGETFDRLRLTAIDLAVFNMEGYEYRLLPHMLEQGLQHRVDRFCVQFHTAYGDEETYRRIKVLFSPTHHIRTDDFPRWVYWERG